MAANHTRHVALTALLANFVDQRVAEGQYQSVSAVIQAALRLLVEREMKTEDAPIRKVPSSQRQGAR
ncbi:type II toxin-antitoxin system ParD family antitoxin [Aurantimonas sp. A2-1-M11]|uniref:type II toxin-antitoxin system ParD family antitoxin n=1 Tax=Aurantimonas sp. A2-1-M11 TaxID=3113712 RepID=UPI002F91D13D